jgi:hypothetical protein
MNKGHCCGCCSHAPKLKEFTISAEIKVEAYDTMEVARIMEKNILKGTYRISGIRNINKS